MNQMLNPQKIVRTKASQMDCKVEQSLGSGGQGEVYRAELGGKPIALKWYYPHYLRQDPRLRERLEEAIKNGPPSDRFLWPIDLAEAAGLPTFGYVMPLREARFKGIVDMMTGRADPSFRALATAGFELANSYLQLHSKGLCYRDISFGNVFFDPDSGEVRICDNDNVDYNLKDGAIGGTPDFMAPEIVQGKALPSTQTDLFSLAVLLFYMFHIHHPLQGRKMMDIHAWDLPARKKILGDEALFIFHTTNRSNEAVNKSVDPTGEAGHNALTYWPIYPQFLRDHFTRAFTDGIRDPHSRVAESIWRGVMIRLRDSIVYCPHCGRQNFYDAEALKASGGKPGPCWSSDCNKEMRLPARIRIDKNIVMLNYDTRLYPHHIDNRRSYDFTREVAAMSQNPTNPSLWGLKNLSGETWQATLPDGTVKIVEPQKTLPLSVGARINFGNVEGEIRM